MSKSVRSNSKTDAPLAQAAARKGHAQVALPQPGAALPKGKMQTIKAVIKSLKLTYGAGGFAYRMKVKATIVAGQKAAANKRPRPETLGKIKVETAFAYDTLMQFNEQIKRGKIKTGAALRLRGHLDIRQADKTAFMATEFRAA